MAIIIISRSRLFSSERYRSIARSQLRVKDKNREPLFLAQDRWSSNSHRSGTRLTTVLLTRKSPSLNIRFEEHSTRNRIDGTSTRRNAGMAILLSEILNFLAWKANVNTKSLKMITNSRSRGPRSRRQRTRTHSLFNFPHCGNKLTRDQTGIDPSYLSRGLTI